MDIVINYWAVVGGAIFLFVMGMTWYGPLFGKTWMRIMGVESMSKEEIAKAQKEMMPMYMIQVALGLVTSFVLYYFVQLIGMHVAFWIWLGFSMPLAAGSMWDTQKGYKMKKFLITAGYQLVTLVVLAFVFARL
ncbi:MAG: hypothetical protein RIQ41_202 [Candidatus Parcubacteria bacterium]|jgi:hypothetical protein